MNNSIDDEWQQYVRLNQNVMGKSNVSSSTKSKIKEVEPDKAIVEKQTTMDNCDELYISTKTKVLFLNQEIDIHRIFWEIPVIEYSQPTNGVVKKQMKIVCKTLEEYEEYCQKLTNIPYYVEHVIKQINNPAARRIKFKDERKITVGISKKDIMNCRGKVKNAFYNCFAMILRFKPTNNLTRSRFAEDSHSSDYNPSLKEEDLNQPVKFEDTFREIHVKIFNTGKMEIPGIPNVKLLDTIKEMILDILRPLSLPIEGSIPLDFLNNENEDSVLINSNFNCGFYINREKLHSILRNKYKIEAAYDPCSYPGVKCRFYFNHENGFNRDIQNGLINMEDCKQKRGELMDNKRYTEVSFMIFRTGSCLIVGNCSEPVLRFIFDFIKNILREEYDAIWTSTEDPIQKNKKTKIRKRSILMTPKYFLETTTQK